MAGVWTWAGALLAAMLAAGDAPVQEPEERSPESTTESERTDRAVALDRVTVVGARGRAARIPGSAHRLDYAQLDALNVGTDDVHRMLSQLPGVAVTEEDGFGLRPNIGMRGTGTDRSANITVMEDGVLIAPAPYAAPAAYYFPLAGRMEAIEVRMGSSQIKYGPRTNGGALNLRSTSIPDASRGRATLSVGGDDARKLYANYGDRMGRVSWLVETSQLTNDGFKRLDGGGPTGFELGDYVGKVRVDTPPGDGLFQSLELKVGYTEETSHETYLGLTDADFADSPLRRYAASQRDVMTNDHRQVQLRHFARLSDRVDVTTTAYRNDFDRNWYKLDRVTAGGESASIGAVLADPSGYAAHYDILTGGESGDDALAVKANNRSYASMGVETITGLAFGAGGARHEVELGLRLHRDEEDRFQHTDDFRMAEGGTMVRTSSGTPGEAGGGDNRVNRADAVALFVQDELSAGRWRVTPGVRFEHVRTTREQYAAGDPDRSETPDRTENVTNVLIPGVGVSYAWSRAVTVFAGAHRGFAPPGPGADDDTEAERSLNVELGARVFDRGFDARVAAFVNAYENLLGKDTLASGGSGSGDLFNAGAVDVYGIEVGVAHRVDLGGDVAVPIGVTTTWTVAEFQSAFESDFEPWGSVEAGDRLPYLPELQLGVSVGVERGRTRARVSGHWMARTRTVAGTGTIPVAESTDARLIVDASGELSLSPNVRGFVSVQNVTDDVYVAARRPAGVRPGLPRRLYGGLKLEL